MADLTIKLNPKQIIAAEILADHSKKRVCFFGGRSSGKTFLLVRTIFSRALQYPESPHLIVRLARARAKQTIWVETILPIAQQLESEGYCRILHGDLKILFANGSYIRLDGLDPSRLTGLLGLRTATVFVNECREAKWETVEALMSGLMCRSVNAAGDHITEKLYCDLNPGASTSWPYRYFERKLHPLTNEPVDDPDQITSLHFSPEDNIENLTRDYIATLKALGPDARKQYYVGEYGSFEGRILPFDESRHVIDDFKLPPMEDRRNWTFFRAIDFGFFPDPFVCLWGAHDQRRGVVVIYRERYLRRIIVSDHAKGINRETGKMFAHWFRPDMSEAELEQAAGNAIDWTVCDHDSEDRATMESEGIPTIAAKKNRRSGIMLMIDVFDAVPGSGKPRIEICRCCVNTITEVAAWRWRDASASARESNDMETDGEDHACDTTRYALMELFGGMIPDFNPVIGFLVESA